MLLPHLAQLPERRARPRHDDQVPVGGERPAAVRLHHRVDQRVGRAGGRVAGRDLRGDPARHPRGPGLPGAGDRQGGLRGEAARADRRGAGPDHRGDRQDRQRPADGGLQPALRPDAGQDEGRVRPGQPRSVTRYLVNAGPLGADSWYRNEGEGSRFTGEGGHFLDTLSWWADSLPEEVYAVGGGPDSDDVQVTVRFANGASGVISYLTGGNVRFPKETLDVTGGGRSARLDNFRKATVWSGRGHETIRARGGQDKGQRAELAAVRRRLRGRRGHADPVRVAGRHHPGHDRGTGQPAERQAGAGVNAAADLAARLVRPPGGPDVARRDGLARPATRWSGRPGRPGR